jgi:hypothetical protein
VAVEHWRLRRILPRLCDDDRARVQAFSDRVDTWLNQAAISVEDFTGQPYIDGMTVEILTTEDRTDIPAGSLRVIETVKPSVYVAGQLLLPAQVILGHGQDATSEERT